MLPSLFKAHLAFHANVSPPAEHQIGMVAVCLKLALRLWKLTNIQVTASKRRNGNQSQKGRFSVAAQLGTLRLHEAE